MIRFSMPDGNSFEDLALAIVSSSPSRRTSERATERRLSLRIADDRQGALVIQLTAPQNPT
ncbi:MAG: hypothetical protein OEN23_09075 [Paracoccaceae bacterium]|nr:hypothetical protein [Paracoccaceae bacterium]